MVPVVNHPIESWLSSHLGSLPFFQGQIFGVSFLAAGIILAIMIIPIITAVSRDAMRAVPNEQREAMYLWAQRAGSQSDEPSFHIAGREL